MDETETSNLNSSYEFSYENYTSPEPEPLAMTARRATIQRYTVLSLRLVTLMLLVAGLTMHVRSLKVFRWEQSFSGGILVTYLVAVIGLALCAASDGCIAGSALQAYLSSTGAAFLLVNAGAIWHYWRHSSEATHAIAELLSVMGLPLKRQLMTKVFLCSAAGVGMLMDLSTVPLFTALKVE
ncbi:hypothetical protein PYW07_000044 [Mythimna separata]|uniref:Uncharacterized protein n=1 Tax=Mythimna separata TaxID=271217 RepID=A0AAD7Z0X5_MYTSE|nr:hypothetical protein PYW07_000044 [Mythimna separata]